jgi:micrococcal nuclease
VYEYRARLVKVVDADTLDLEVDPGFRLRFTDRFRLSGINAPEMKTAEGVAARVWLATLLDLACAAGTADNPWPLVVATEKDRREKFGRWLATVRVAATGLVVNAELVKAGHAAVAHY